MIGHVKISAKLRKERRQMCIHFHKLLCKLCSSELSILHESVLIPIKWNGYLLLVLQTY